MLCAMAHLALLVVVQLVVLMLGAMLGAVLWCRASGPRALKGCVRALRGMPCATRAGWVTTPR